MLADKAARPVGIEAARRGRPDAVEPRGGAGIVMRRAVALGPQDAGQKPRQVEERQPPAPAREEMRHEGPGRLRFGGNERGNAAARVAAVDHQTDRRTLRNLDDPVVHRGIGDGAGDEPLELGHGELDVAIRAQAADDAAQAFDPQRIVEAPHDVGRERRRDQAIGNDPDDGQTALAHAARRQIGHVAEVTRNHANALAGFRRHCSRSAVQRSRNGLGRDAGRRGDMVQRDFHDS